MVGKGAQRCARILMPSVAPSPTLRFLIFKQPSSAAPILCGAGYAVFPFAPRPRGAERRQALVRIAAPVARLAVGPISRAKGDHRPMTLAGAPFGAPPRHFSDL